MPTVITDDIVSKVARLAKINVSSSDAQVYAQQLESILDHFGSLNKIDVAGVEPTYQVTGLKSIMRDDVIDTDRMFSQKQALSNAPNSRDGYFVTKLVSKK